LIKNVDNFRQDFFIRNEKYLPCFQEDLYSRVAVVVIVVFIAMMDITVIMEVMFTLAIMFMMAKNLVHSFGTEKQIKQLKI
jgi:hypothetical protein